MPKIRPLTPLLAVRAQEELGEVPERIDEDIKALRDWILKQPHLKARTDDQWLVAFLRGTKYSLEKAKQKFECFYSMRHVVPELYKHRSVDDPKTMDILKQGCFLRLPTPLKEDGPRIHVSRFGYDPNKYNLADMYKVNSMIGEIQYREDDNAMVCGYVEVIDLKGVGAGHIFQFEPLLVKKFAALGEKAWPVRQKGFHVVNAPKGTETVLSLVRTLLSEKIRKRFHIHSNYESLYEHIPKECLPVEYGGQNGTIQDVIDVWVKKFQNYRDYFITEAQYGTNEKLRPSKSSSKSKMLDMDGSFRKLEID